MPDTEDSLPCPEPKVVVYHPVTGVPEEYHDFLHKDSDEYKRLKEATEATTSAAIATEDAAAGAVANLSLGAEGAAAAEGEAPPADEKVKKKKKKAEKEVVISRAQRQRKKCITTVEGLDLFGVKLADAAKLFGKKYACGASVVKNPSLKDQIDIQGDVQEVIPELIIKTYGDSNEIKSKHIFMIIEKERVQYEP